MLYELLQLSLAYTGVGLLCYRLKPRGCFGFAGGGGSSGSSTTTQELAPEQKDLLKLVLPEAENISKNTPQLFPGSTIAGFDPLQIYGQNAAVQTAGGPATQVAQSGANANQFLTSGAVLDPRRNPGLQGAIEAAIRPLTRDFTTNVLPGVRSEAINAGGLGGSRQGIAEGLATQGYQNALSDTISRVVNPAYQSGLGAFTQGISNVPTVQQGLLTPAQVVEAVGSQRQGLAQSQLSEAAQRYLNEQILPFNVAQDIAALAFGIGGGKSTTSSQGGGTNPLQALLGLGSIAAPFFTACWVAREVYGSEGYRWLVFREWMLNEAPALLRNTYLKYGERFASWLRNKPRVKAVVRYLMNIVVERKPNYGF